MDFFQYKSFLTGTDLLFAIALLVPDIVYIKKQQNRQNNF